jgi:hypothetical protein
MTAPRSGAARRADAVSTAKRAPAAHRALNARRRAGGLTDPGLAGHVALAPGIGSTCVAGEAGAPNGSFGAVFDGRAPSSIALAAHHVLLARPCLRSAKLTKECVAVLCGFARFGLAEVESTIVDAFATETTAIAVAPVVAGLPVREGALEIQLVDHTLALERPGAGDGVASTRAACDGQPQRCRHTNHTHAQPPSHSHASVSRVLPATRIPSRDSRIARRINLSRGDRSCIFCARNRRGESSSQHATRNSKGIPSARPGMSVAMPCIHEALVSKWAGQAHLRVRVRPVLHGLR